MEAEDAAEWVRRKLGLYPDEKQALMLRSASKRGVLNCARQWGKSRAERHWHAVGRNEDIVKSVEGVYRNGKVELIEPLDDAEGARVIRQSQAADLRHRLAAFAEDWDRPEMSVYDDLPSR